MRSVVLNTDYDQAARIRRRLVLEQAGFETIESETCEEAIRIARSDTVAAVLTSSRLKDTDGFVLCRELKGTPRTAGIPVLVVSPSSSMDEYARAVEAGADTWLGEPFDASVLIKVLQAMLSKNGQFGALKSLAQARGDEQTEELLHQSEERFRQVFQAIPEPTLIASVVDGKITDINSRFLEVGGYSRHEVIGKTTEDVGLFLKQADRKSVWAELLEKGWLSDFEVIFRTKGGALLLGLLSSVTVSVQGQEYVVSTIRDVTQRRRAEEALRRQASFDRLLNGLLSAFARCNTNEISAEIDRGLNALAGYFGADHLMLFDVSPVTNTWRISREWCARHVVPIASQHNEGCYWSNDNLFSDTEVMIDMEDPGVAAGYDIQRYREEGATLILNVPIKGAGGLITGRIGLHRHGGRVPWTAEDASRLRVAGSAIAAALEHMRLEESVRRSEQRFRSMADAAPMGTWISGPEKQAVFYNKWAIDFAGLPMSALTGNGWMDLVHPEDRERYVAAWFAAADAREPFSAEARFRRMDGEYRWILVSGVPRMVGDTYQGHVGTGVDITNLKRAYEQTLASQKLESLGLLTAGVAHNFNNLLSAIIVLAESRLSEMEPNGEGAEDLQQIRGTALQAANIASHIMAFAGTESAPTAPLELSQFITPMLDLLRASISRTANLHTELAADLPNIDANPGEIQQVIMNLVVNASEALAGKPGNIVITTSAGPSLAGSRSTVSLEVKDTGTGMTDDTKNRIFDPFFTTQPGRRGLGLSAVQGIVRRHGGSIEVESQPGEGNRITILFPRSEAASPKLNPTDGPVRDASGNTVLLVEDELSLRLVTAKLLAKRGFRVIEAADGASAIQMLRIHRAAVGVIILDVTLPEMSGSKIFDELRLIKPDVNVIVTTAHSRETVTMEFGTREIQGFIRKPYQVDELDQALVRIFEPKTVKAGAGSVSAG